MFGLGQKRQEKKAKKELEKLEKKEAKVKEKLAKLEEKQKKKEEKKNKGKKQEAPEPEKPAYKKYRYDFYVDGMEPYLGHIRYDLTRYDPDYAEGIEEDEKRYKYRQTEYRATLQDDGEKITVIIGEYIVGFVPKKQVDEVRKIITENSDLDIYCNFSGGDYIAKLGRTVDKGTDPWIFIYTTEGSIT